MGREVGEGTGGEGRGGEGRDDGYTYCNRYVPRIVTSSNVSSEFALLKTTANSKSAALKTAVNNNTIDIHLTFKYGK